MRFLMVALLMVSSLTAAKLTWFHSYDRALAQARATDKNIYVFIDALGCPYCERMRHEVLQAPDVVRSLAGYVLLNLKVSSPDAQKHFPHVQVTPTSYFMTAEGKILLDFAGYTNEEFFFWRMADAEQIDAAQKKKK